MRSFLLLLALMPVGCGSSSIPVEPPVDLAVVAGDQAAPVPVMTSVSPKQWSRSMTTKMTISGTHLDDIATDAKWTFGSCKVASYSGNPVSASAYELTLTPSAAAAVGDQCSLTLVQTSQTLANAFDTGL